MIITVALIVLWCSVLLMFHSYVLYPLVLRLFAIGKTQNKVLFDASDSALPNVFIVFAVYNEEKVIREKLEGVFKTTYPLSKLKVYIGSDNSIDATNKIVAEFGAKYPQLVFFPYTNRNGKAQILNRLVNSIFEAESVNQNDVFIFTDANVMFTPTTVFELTKHFKNEQIGQVGANILNKGVKDDGISRQEKSYIQRENYIKYLEGINWGSMIGAFGACYAMRASLWKNIPLNYLMEDFYLSMNVLAQKSKAIVALDAICYEDVSNEAEEELKRKVRIQAGNFQNMGVYWPLLFRFNAVAFCFLSHKVIRWLGPVFIILSYISNICLLPISQFYLFTFAVQNLLLISPLIDGLFKRMGIHLILLRFASYFYLMNFALVKGFIMYLKGIKTSAWDPTKRNI
ncbi:MAG TPA: glycosyltransferase [Chitinophagales bacterium]|nr:glycosyltransferase [Chitinophagales bacterium]